MTMTEPAPHVNDGDTYVWPCWFGGVTRSAKPPEITSKLRDLRRAVGSLAAKKQQGGPQFPVRSAKELMQKLAEALDELNLVAPVIAQEVHHFDTANIPSNATASGKPVFRTLAHVKSTVRVGASDGSYVDMVGSGHGGDVDDKAGGKADTYAWKSAILKGLTLPEQDMTDTDDEAPSEREAAKRPDVKVPKVDAVTPVANEDSTKSFIARVDAADDAGLDGLKEEVMDGRHGFSMADKLKISAAFVKRRKAIEQEGKSDK